MGKEVSRSTEAKIKALLGRGLPSAPGRVVGGGTERYDTHIRITGDVYREQEEESESDSGSGAGEFVPEEWVGYWPGVITHWNPTDAVWLEFGPCLVLPANWGDFIVGKRYRALCYGNVLQGLEWERLVLVADDDDVPDDESGSGSDDDVSDDDDGSEEEYTATLTVYRYTCTEEGGLVETPTTYTITSSGPIDISED